jgi:Pex14 N-terminal domain
MVRYGWTFPCQPPHVPNFDNTKMNEFPALTFHVISRCSVQTANCLVAYFSSPPPTMPPREELISSAVTFLSDPKVQSSPLTKRLSFLESKGLTQEEITEVLNRLNNPPTTPTPPVSPPVPQYAAYGNPYGPPPEVPARDWRDWFIMAVVTSGLSYGVYTIAKVSHAE